MEVGTLCCRSSLPWHDPHMTTLTPPSAVTVNNTGRSHPSASEFEIMLESERIWPEEKREQLIRRLKQPLYSTPVSMETWLDLMNAAGVHENMFV